MPIVLTNIFNSLPSSNKKTFNKFLFKNYKTNCFFKITKSKYFWNWIYHVYRLTLIYLHYFFYISSSLRAVFLSFGYRIRNDILSFTQQFAAARWFWLTIGGASKSSFDQASKLEVFGMSLIYLDSFFYFLWICSSFYFIPSKRWALTFLSFHFFLLR